MTMYHGPATWFLTLSPSEWTWDELGNYMHKINPSLAKLSASALVVADPVSGISVQIHGECTQAIY